MASLASAAGVAMRRSESFWAASQAWTAQRRRQVDAVVAAGQGRSDQIVRKAARWQAATSRYLRHYGNLGEHYNGITVDPKLHGMVLDLMAGIAPRLQAAFDEHLGKLAFDAWRAWPVASGFSKSLIGLEYEVSEGGDAFTGRVRSAAPYTVFIAGQPHRALIDRPGAEAADRIATDALDEIARMGG